MKKLKLKKGLSYAVKGFSCVKGAAFEAADGLAEKLMKTGRFEEASGEEAGGGPGKALSADDIAGMKKEQLVSLAAEYGISLEDCKNNEERIGRIQGALGLASFVQMGLEN